MKTFLLISLFLLSSTAIARIYCVEQAQMIAESAYGNSFRIKDQIGKTLVTELEYMKWEFDFKEGEKNGNKITVTMTPQNDPGTHCEIKKLNSLNY